MFLTCDIEDNLRVLPSELGSDTLEAVTAVIEEAYLDFVVPDCGLVVSLYDIRRVEGGFIYHSEGAVHFDVQFTVVVFRPLLGELLVGTLVKSSKDGVWVSLGFFDDIFVPDYNLQQPSHFDSEDGVWVWQWEGNTLFMDEGTEVRLRVKDVKFHPVPTLKQLEARGEELLGTQAQPFVPLEIVGAMNSDGLGCIDWWAPADEDGMAEE